MNFALNYDWGCVLQSQECSRHREACEERGVEVDEGWRDGDEEVVWLAALLLFSMKAEEDKAPLAGRLSCWDLEPIIKRLRYLLFLNPPSLHVPPLLLWSIALLISFERSCTHNWLIMLPKTLCKSTFANTNYYLLTGAHTVKKKTEQIHEGDNRKAFVFPQGKKAEMSIWLKIT